MDRRTPSQAPDVMDAHLRAQQMRVAIRAKDTPTDRLGAAVDLSFLAPSQRPGALGRLDHYDVLEVRGQGGFGVVLRAFDEKLQRIVALKVLPPHFAASEQARQRFLREAQAAAAVHNDHVVSIFAVESSGPCPYIAMQYVEGPSLQEKLERDGPCTLEEILQIGQQAACGLAAAHRQGLIHRDVKPSNILLENGVARVKITDFGLARAVDDAGISQTGIVYGTPAYMAPEQATGQRVDARADLFSLGSVLYTLATGCPPFRADSSLATLRCVQEHSVPPLCMLRPDLPVWLEDLVAKLHAKKPSRRFQTAQEVADLLATHLAAVKVHGSAYVPASARRRTVVRGLMLGQVMAALTLAVFVGWRVMDPGTPVAEVKAKGANVGDEARPVRKADTPAPVAPPLASVPFDAAQALPHQQAWAQYLKVPAQKVNTMGMKLCLLPAGEFISGGAPAHHIRITEPFYIGAYEVTVAEFFAFVEATHYKTQAERDPLGGKIWNPEKRRVDQRPDIHWRTPGIVQTERHPVCCVTWHDAVAFCRWLSQQEKKTYRLPTEAEWEYACRAGTTTPYYYGATADLARMNVRVRCTTPVGSYAPNAFGLFDMHGNVYEWCLDAPGSAEAGLAINPRGPDDGPKRVMRGGGYSSGLGDVSRSDYRSVADADHAYTAIGFRVLLECR
jgi:formylglycine-generating enzyme required for sulfatase activity